ncbi:MAG TPA: TfoX/Sxy family protein [Tahibacter sp.]|nr:TfoX/Sxy family protein [Tahibacter sp.]
MTSDLHAYLTELFGAFGPIRVKAMFGGHGVYCGELFFAVVIDGEIGLKVDNDNKQAFVDAGCAPLVYTRMQEPMPMSYWSVPAEALDSAEAMRPWARLALDAAARKASAKHPPKAKKR